MSGSIWNPGLPAALALSLQLVQSANVAGTVTSNEADVVGNLIYLQGSIIATAVGTAAAPISINISALLATLKANAVGLPIGQFLYSTLAGTRYTGVVYLNSQTQLRFIVTGSTGGAAALLGTNPAVTIAIGDVLAFSAILPLA